MAAHLVSSSSSCGSNYEVFLSFHGKDVRTNFADHLYNALVYSGIRTFRDQEELPKGNEIGPELLAAIQQSRISIPIFSENYASSKWCLNELTEISECKRTMDQIVFPIFYKVDPRDVRNQKRKYAEAFVEHQMRFDEATVQKWKKALREVGELDGWDSKRDTYEGKLIKEVVKKVWSTLNKRPLIVSNNLVGIQSHIKEMLMLLDIESDSRKIIGIHGIGGIGKTTIARTVYNTVFHHFEGYSFIENIQENAKKHGLPHLQNQLIFDILKEENRNITSVDDGIIVIQQRFCQRKVLIVLDDVDQDNQAKSLVGDCKWFGIGSKIIITSRNEDVLIAQKVDGIYEPKVMDLEDSLELFSYHSFGRDRPPADYLDLSQAMVKTTGGLPLALQVIGSSLYLKGKLVWEGMLKKLGRIPNKDVMKRLKISYDGLDDEEQQMFLDVACFFIGMNKDIALPIWDGCGFSSLVGIDALCVRSLVTISEEGVLRMHDQLRDLGRQIVRQESIDEPGKRSRIWSQEDVLEVLDTLTGTSNVKGLSCIDFNGISRSQCLRSEGFAAMRKLRLLQVDYARFFGNLFTHSFSELRWFSWKGCPDDQYAQTNFCPQKLAVLDLSYSKITENWMGWNCIKMAVNLKVLNLTSCSRLSRSPDLSANRHLEVLILKDSVNFVEINNSIGYLRKLLIFDMTRCEKLVDLPIENCHFTSLKRLDLTGCENLEKLSGKLGHMISLTTLNLSGCKRLVDLPIENCQLTSLKRLDLMGCENLEKLPAKLGHMISLTTLNLSGCERLVDLPIEICQLTSLKTLDLSGCKSLNKLPLILGHMISLTTLDLRRCRNLVDLPVEICQLTFLNTLKLSGCQSLVNLPAEICKLTSLGRLYLWGCRKLLHISNLPLNLTSLDVSNCSAIRYISGLPSSLTSLDAGGCESMEKLSSTSGLRNLERLYLDGCNNLEEIEGADGGLDSLVLFRMLRCQSLKKIPNLSSSKKMRELLISDCPELSKIEGLEDCGSLETLTISKATSLKTLLDFSNLNKLQVLTIEHYWELTEIQGLDRLEFLRTLDIIGCESLEKLSNLSNLKKLEQLRATACKKLTKIQCVDRLDFLVKLDINRCKSLERLLDLSNLNNLKELRAKGCKKLTEIHGVDRLDSLELLDIRRCESLEILLDLSNLKKLEQLRAKACKKVTEIHCVERLEFLVKLDIDWCESLERLPDLSNLNNLKELRANGCNKLTDIHGVDRLHFLQLLDISGCTSLERLPDLSNLNDLKKLRANGCMKLTDIHGVDRLEFLELLDISGCASLERLPDLSNLKYLEQLSAEACKKLTEIHCVDKLEFLVELDIDWCESLERLPDLSNLNNLKELRACGCKKLTEIHGVNRLEFLRKLDVSGCKSLKGFPDLSNLKSLKELRANGCRKLTEIHAGNGLESLRLLDIRGCISLEKIPDLTNLKEFCNLNGEDCWGPTEIANVYRLRVELLTDGGSTKLQQDLSNLTCTFSNLQRFFHRLVVEELLTDGGSTKLKQDCQT